MYQVSFPDGSLRTYSTPKTVLQIASDIGPGLAKSAVAASVNDDLVDIGFLISENVSLKILTSKDEDGLGVIRHSTAHLMAQAVKLLFPNVQVTIGPVIENGFYYDFAFEGHFTEADLGLIEKKMFSLVEEAFSIQREVWQRDDAIQFFKDQKEYYKVEIINSIPLDQTITMYRQGDFIDLCRGPHAPSTSFLKSFKLLKVSGAYWRGDSKNAQLQRIYGTAWANKKDLESHLRMLEEAEKRDHRKLGQELDLFHIQNDAPGLVFWHPDGWQLWQAVEQYMRSVYQEEGYKEVRCPQVLNRKLWEKSGHWSFFKEHIFVTESENREYAIKPMNCPGHVQIFNTDIRSYKDLPLRYGEFGSCHRNEPSGALHGLMRVRGFTQDDGHVFCSKSQIQSETSHFIKSLRRVYDRFDFREIKIKLALRPDERMGSEEIWNSAENSLREALRADVGSWEELPGEGAFYGPKIEFHVKDAIGRSWQCGTLQVDFFMPSNLGAEYITENNTRETPVMLHRAILGSLERFIGILIEHYSGNFPLWLAPIQVVVMPVSEHQEDYAKEVHQTLKKNEVRAVLDIRNEKISYKIREHSLRKRPFCLIVGDKEKASSQVSVRAFGKSSQEAMLLSSFIDLFSTLI